MYVNGAKKIHLRMSSNQSQNQNHPSGKYSVLFSHEIHCMKNLYFLPIQMIIFIGSLWCLLKCTVPVCIVGFFVQAVLLMLSIN